MQSHVGLRVKLGIMCTSTQLIDTFRNARKDSAGSVSLGFVKSSLLCQFVQITLWRWLDLPRSELRLADKRNPQSFSIVPDERAVKVGLIIVRP